MKYKRVRGSIKQAAYFILLGLGFSGCATSDANYADRNNIDSARSRCVQLARTMGYQDVGSIQSIEMVERNGKLDWSCEKTEKTVKSGANTTRVPIESIWMINWLLRQTIATPIV